MKLKAAAIVVVLSLCGSFVSAQHGDALDEVITDKTNGRLLSFPHQREVEDALTSILADAHLGATYAHNARQTIVNTASLEVAGAKLHDFYTNLFRRESLG